MVDWGNPEEVKEHRKNYYEANKEEIKAKQKNYYETHKEELNAANREYIAKNRTMKYHGYGGVYICPKCGHKGYKNYYKISNKKTGHSSLYTVVRHQHSEEGKTVSDGVCYIGVGEL